jgi:hypothetical protein
MIPMEIKLQREIDKKSANREKLDIKHKPVKISS